MQMPPSWRSARKPRSIRNFGRAFVKHGDFWGAHGSRVTAVICTGRKRIAGFGVAPKQSFLSLPASAGITRPKAKFAIARTRSLPQARDETHALPRVREHMRDYSPKRWRNCARAYSRFNFAIKLALISAGHTASHS